MGGLDGQLVQSMPYPWGESQPVDQLPPEPSPLERKAKQAGLRLLKEAVAARVRGELAVYLYRWREAAHSDEPVSWWQKLLCCRASRPEPEPVVVDMPEAVQPAPAEQAGLSPSGSRWSRRNMTRSLNGRIHDTSA